MKLLEDLIAKWENWNDTKMTPLTCASELKSILPVLAQAAADRDTDQREIGQQTAEAILQSYLSGGFASGFVHELTKPMLDKFVADRDERWLTALEQWPSSRSDTYTKIVSEFADKVRAESAEAEKEQSND